MLTHPDFVLRQEELEAINSIVNERVAKLALAGEDPCDGVSVTFEFSPFGRDISVSVSGGPYKLVSCYITAA